MPESIKERPATAPVIEVREPRAQGRPAKPGRLPPAPEVWSTRLSILGAALAVPATASLLVPAVAARSPVHILSFSVYGIGMLGMFIASAVFHGHAGRERRWLKNIDYCAISFMIAGLLLTMRWR